VFDVSLSPRSHAAPYHPDRQAQAVVRESSESDSSMQRPFLHAGLQMACAKSEFDIKASQGHAYRRHRWVRSTATCRDIDWERCRYLRCYREANRQLRGDKMRTSSSTNTNELCNRIQTSQRRRCTYLARSTFHCYTISHTNLQDL
jgi:hypothetical protein